MTFGYYAHGVGPETAKAPAGWEQRLVRVAVSLGDLPLNEVGRTHVESILRAIIAKAE